MASVVNFECPCCAAQLTFSGTTGEMTCAYCGSTFSVEQVMEANRETYASAQKSDMTWSSEDTGMIRDENGQVSGYVCPSCAAELVADANTAATECPYCGNPAILPQSFSGMYKPELVVPFSVDKKQAKEALAGFYKGKKLLPRSFTEGNRIQQITGLYVPFWLFSCRAKGSATFEGVKSKTWEDAQYRYEKKDYYNLRRSGEMDFEQIPVDASTKMDDDTMDSLEPYDLTKAVPYNAAYFSGYLADRYDVQTKDAEPRANERVKNTFLSKLEESTKEFQEVRRKTEYIQLENAKAQYAMLPVWMMSTKYEDQIYTFGVNGQTGKMVGSLPVDKGKYFRYLALATVIAMAVLQIAVYFLGGHAFGWKGEAIALVISLVIGFVYAQSLKSAMNTIAKGRSATSYLIDKSVKVHVDGNNFLYSKTNKTQKAQSNNNQK